MRGGKTPQHRNRRATVLDKPERSAGAEAGFGADDAPTYSDEQPFDPADHDLDDGVGDVDESADVDDEPAPAIPMLHVALHEAAPHLAAAERAIQIANHAVVVATTGREGMATVAHALAAGGVDAVVVGMPGGEIIIDAAHMVTPRRPVIIAAYNGLGTDAVINATNEGADLVTLRPHDPDRLAVVLLAAARLIDDRAHLRGARRGVGTSQVRWEDLTRDEPRGLLRFDVFQRVLEHELKSARRHHNPLSLAVFSVDVPLPALSSSLMKLVRARASLALLDAMRDFDLATELDSNRFLMLFPYTDLIEAAEVSRAVIAAVNAGEPVIADGRSVAYRLIGAVAGAAPGSTPSFARLVRDATRALERARNDGVDLLVSTREDDDE
ncbi:MAG: hypothetical protein AB7O24_05955 [Kofleriaceae bacterium]